METNTKPKMTPKDFFLYVGVMALLYGSVISLINLLFGYIDYTFPDAQYFSGDFYSTGIRFAIATLIVVFPVFLFGSWHVNKEIRQTPEKFDLPIRKWLIYLALFIAGVSILIDLVVLIDRFLGGELTTRFGLKVLVVLVTAGFAFYYYWLDMKGVIRERASLGHILGGIALVVVLVSVVAGFFIVGTPGEQRSLRFDETRVSNLQDIQWQVVTYWQQKRVLPENLSELKDTISGYSTPVDPESGEEYGYRVLSAKSFELCADFNLESKSASLTKEPYRAYDLYFINENWQHEPGRVCFERVIDPERYPPFPKTDN